MTPTPGYETRVATGIRRQYRQGQGEGFGFDMQGIPLHPLVGGADSDDVGLHGGQR